MLVLIVRLKGLIKGRDDVIMQLRSQINELEEFEMVNQQLKEQLQQKEKEFNVINVKNKYAFIVSSSLFCFLFLFLFCIFFFVCLLR